MHVCHLLCSMVTKVWFQMTWMQRLQHYDIAMLFRICGVKAVDCILSDGLLTKLHLFYATGNLRWDYVCQVL